MVFYPIPPSECTAPNAKGDEEPVKANTRLNQICDLDYQVPASAYRLSGIVCTIGPGSKDVPVLMQMMTAGMCVARLNFSHGTYEFHGGTIQNIRNAVDMYSKKIGRYYPLAIALDTKGPEIRTGLLEGGARLIELKKDDMVKLTTDKNYFKKCSAKTIYVDYENIVKVISPGKRVYIDDGSISLVCNAVQGTDIICTVENSGMLGNQKGVNLPGIPVDLPAVTEKDKNDLLWGVEQGVDIIFASFIRDAAGVNEIRSILGDAGKRIMIISKLESQQGMDNLDDIIQASDGIMSARGDLGIEIPAEKVFLATKTMISRCNRAGKPVICATQMLQSMVKKTLPTSAEGCDVANAILDGADCVMLSEETASGQNPVLCVQTMSDISREAEAMFWNKQIFDDLVQGLPIPIDPIQATALAAVESCNKVGASAIIAVTTSGRSAQLISKFKPKCPIVAVTRHEQTARQLNLFRAVVPIFYDKEKEKDWLKDLEAKIKAGILYGISLNFIKVGQPVVAVSGWRQSGGFTNTLRVFTVTEDIENTCEGICS